MIKAVGIDIIQINRIKSVMNNTEKILSLKETVLYKGLATLEAKIHFLAGRWAVKEAILKACGSDSVVSLPSVNIMHNNTRDGKDSHLIVEGVKLAPQERIHISISHDTDYATAVAIFESYA